MLKLNIPFRAVIGALNAQVQFVLEPSQMRVLARNERTAESLAQRCELRFQHAAVAEFKKTNAGRCRARHQRPKRRFDPSQTNAVAILGLSGRFAEQARKSRPESAVRLKAGIEELYHAFVDAHLAESDWKGPRYYRLPTVKGLQDRGVIDAELRRLPTDDQATVRP